MTAPILITPVPNPPAPVAPFAAPAVAGPDGDFIRVLARMGANGELLPAAVTTAADDNTVEEGEPSDPAPASDGKVTVADTPAALAFAPPAPDPRGPAAEPALRSGGDLLPDRTTPLSGPPAMAVRQADRLAPLPDPAAPLAADGRPARAAAWPAEGTPPPVPAQTPPVGIPAQTSGADFAPPTPAAGPQRNEATPSPTFQPDAGPAGRTPDADPLPSGPEGTGSTIPAPAAAGKETPHRSGPASSRPEVQPELPVPQPKPDLPVRTADPPLPAPPAETAPRPAQPAGQPISPQGPAQDTPSPPPAPHGADSEAPRSKARPADPDPHFPQAKDGPPAQPLLRTVAAQTPVRAEAGPMRSGTLSTPDIPQDAQPDKHSPPSGPAPALPEGAGTAPPRAPLATLPEGGAGKAAGTVTDHDIAQRPDGTAAVQPNHPPDAGRPQQGQAAPPVTAQLLPELVRAAMAPPDAPLTITLRPQELGALHYQMVQGPDGMQIHLSVDEPATLDLLRRHGDAILADLRQAGFAGATLTFSGGGAGGDDAPRNGAAPPLRAEEDRRATTYQQPRGAGSGTLDLRL